MTMCEVYCIVIFSFFFFSVFVPRRLPIGMVKELVEITLKKKKKRKTKLETLETASPQHFS